MPSASATSSPLRLSADTRDYLLSLHVRRPESKDEARRLLLERKREQLIAHRAELRRLESRAVALLRRVEYDAIRPKLVHLAPSDKPLWGYYRRIVSSAPWTGRPGRANYLLAVDERTSGVLGIVDVGSDLQSLGPRDRYIGWTAARKFSGGLNHVANVGTCICAHPFGRLTGGKFQLVACTTRTIVQTWERRYGDVLAGITTTALYGRSSVYNRIREFAYLGDTPGQGTFHLDDAGFALLKRFLRDNGLRSRNGGTAGLYENKSDVVFRACSALGIAPELVQTHQPRGVYFAALGEDALPFLRGEDSNFAPLDRSQEDVRDWWLTRWYAPRYAKLHGEIAAFDWTIYSVDAQIALCGEAIRAGSIDSDASADQAGEDCATPSRRSIPEAA